MTAQPVWDVIVVGGGPAGSTASHLLAKDGHRVLVLDKDQFPRFHIGESLLPCDVPLFARLGMDMAACRFLRKQGAEFIDEARGRFAFYDFADALPGGPGYAYQVERASFDHELLKLAQKAGAHVEFGTRVREVACDTAGVRVKTDTHEYAARFVIDASGQDALLGRRGRSLEPLRQLGRGAVFCHFDNVADEIWNELARLGNIKVLIRDDGWMWMIPLTGGRVSVGFVSNVRALELETLDEVLAESPVLQRIIAGAQRSQTRLARNFSYTNRESTGLRYACVGDASCFLDPVFSSGVSLGMLGAEHLADALSPALRAGTEAEPGVLTDYATKMRHAYQVLGSLVYSFYNTKIVRNTFFAPDPDPELRSGLVSILAGDVWRTGNRFQNMLLSSPRRQLAVAP